MTLDDSPVSALVFDLMPLLCYAGVVASEKTESFEHSIAYA